jgi:hypothetical protein
MSRYDFVGGRETENACPEVVDAKEIAKKGSCASSWLGVIAEVTQSPALKKPAPNAPAKFAFASSAATKAA